MKYLRKYYDYLIVLILYFLVFWNNAFKSTFTLDYTPSYLLNFSKELIISNFQGTWYLFYFFEFIFSKLNISKIFFSFSILITLFISYYYIKKQHKLNKLFLIIFFFNPFIYSRIMVGHLGVILAYLLIPVFIYYLFKFFDNDFSKSCLIKLVILFTLAVLLQPQFFIIYLLFFILASIYTYFYKKKFNLRRYTKIIIILIALLVFSNSYWFQGFFSDTVFTQIDQSHEEFFSPKLSQDIPAIVKIIGMWGFWRETGYIVTHKTLPLWLWYSLTFMFIILMHIGYYNSNNKRKSKFFYSTWWIGLIFATGISHPYTAPLFDFFFKYIPFFSGFRDSHKLVTLIALSYAYFCPIGIVWIRKKLKKISYGIPIFFIGLIILYTYPLIGLWGQIKPIDYPQNYQETNKFLKKQEFSGHIIYLPWEGYLTYNWTINSTPDGRITVPINKLVQPVILTSPGIWGKLDNTKKNIGLCLQNNSISCLEKQGVQYILKDKCTFYPKKYSWINKTKVHEDKCIEIYQINNININRKIRFQGKFIIGFLVSLLTWVFLIYSIICNAIPTIKK